MHALRAHRQISENCHVQMGNYNAIRLAVDHFVVLSLRFCVGGFHFSSQSQSGKNSKFLPWVSGNLTASSIANICRLLLVGVVNNTTIILHSDGKHPHCWRNLGVSYRVGRYAWCESSSSLQWVLLRRGTLDLRCSYSSSGLCSWNVFSTHFVTSCSPCPRSPCLFSLPSLPSLWWRHYLGKMLMYRACRWISTCMDLPRLVLLSAPNWPTN